MSPYNAKSPVLFLVFNRPDVTKKVFEAIRQAQPAKLYIAADGPRADREGEAERCIQTRQLFENIDWDCEIHTLFREHNLGCKEAISSAVTWFFEQEEEGIILEDDCLPSPSFFKYCDTLLKKYRFDTRIRHITGANHHFGRTWGTSNIYFAHQTHVWGWASWRRVWQDYDKDLNQFEESEVEEQFNKIFDDRFVIEAWMDIFKRVKAGAIDTWDYQLALLNFFNNGLSVNPNVNLITNIGFREDATHTVDLRSPYANLPFEDIGEITYPKYMLPDKAADYEVFRRDYRLDEKWQKHNLLRRRFKRWLKSGLK